MKTIYKIIKQTARKYSFPALVAGSLALGSCSNEDTGYLQINRDSKEIVIKNLESLSKKADSYVVSAKNIFWGGVGGGELSKGTMTKTLNYLQKADSLYSIIQEYTKANSLEKSLSNGLSKKDAKLMSRHYDALKGFDLGIAELEKDLAKEGFNVDVYNIDFSKDEGDVLAGGVIALAFLCLYGLIKVPDNWGSC